MDVTAVKTDWEVPKQEESMELMPESEDEVIPFDVLAQDSPKAPNIKQSAELANASSIAFILRCDDLSILMLGDCYPHNVEAYLRSKGYSEDNPLAVDFVKVAHHGSRHNTSNELLDIILCNNYIISTNGQKFGHPDRECLAHILCHPRRDRNEKVHFYFNCDLKTIEKNAGTILYADEPETWNFEIHENANEIDPLEPALRHGQGSAQEHAQGPVVIDRATLKKLTAEANASPNLRKNLDLRNSPEDQSHADAECDPRRDRNCPLHRHLKSSETVVCLRRASCKKFFTTSNGTVTEVFDLVPNSKCMGLSIPKGQWHKAVAIKSGTVILETKDGP
jgi:Predicted hydrolase (metallo-beta-lactamase superfamily)